MIFACSYFSSRSAGPRASSGVHIPAMSERLVLPGGQRHRFVASVYTRFHFARTHTPRALSASLAPFGPTHTRGCNSLIYEHSIASRHTDQTHGQLFRSFTLAARHRPFPSAGALSCSGDPSSPELFQANLVGDRLVSIDGIPHSAADIFKNLVETLSPNNFVGSFSTPNVLAVMFLAMVFGLSIAHVHPSDGSSRVLVDAVTQLREVSVLRLHCSKLNAVTRLREVSARCLCLCTV